MNPKQKNPLREKSEEPPVLDMSLLERVEAYFRWSTKEQIDADLKACNFDYWNKVGVNFIPYPKEKE